MQTGNILLTGESGFLGSILFRTLKSDPKTFVLGLQRSVGGRRIDITRNFTFNFEKTIDTVIHAAGKAHSVPKNEGERQEFYHVNLEGTKNLCRALSKSRQLPRSFIFISTVAIYGVDEGCNIDENYIPNGHTPYANSKLLAEKWLENWAAKYNIKLGILRLPLVVGPNPPGNLRAMIGGIKSGRYLSVGKSDARKSMVWAEDIARIIPDLAGKGGVYNLTDGIHPTFRELEMAISNTLNKRKPITVPYWVAKGLAVAGDILGRRFPINSEKLKKMTSTLTFDDSKARSELGWNPTPILSKVDEFAATL